MIPKFRAWLPTLKWMCEVTVIDYDLRSVDICRIEDVARHTEMRVDKDEVVLMQSTGIKDKNGTEIFEGDALKNNDYPNQTFICKHSKLQASFQAESLNGLLTLSFWKDEERDWQVLGNIYENPELLEADNDTK